MSRRGPLRSDGLPDGRGGYLMRRFRYAPDLGDDSARVVLGARFERAAPEERDDRLDRHAIRLAVFYGLQVAAAPVG